MLTDLIEPKKRELEVREAHVPSARDDSDWGKAKAQVDLLTSNFGMILDEAMNNRFESIKHEKKHKDAAATIKAAPVMGNDCVLQIINTEKQGRDKARYILTETNGNRSYIRDLVS